MHNNKATSYSREELYRAVEDMCINKLAPNLYTQLKAVCNEHIEFVVNSLIGQSPDHVDFLSLVETKWNEFCTQMSTIRSIFLYLDRTYVIQTPQLVGLWNMGNGSMGIVLFREHLMKNSELVDKIVTGLLYLVGAERNGESISHSLLRSILRMLSSLGIYDQQFQIPFINQSILFFASESAKLMDETHISSYLLHVEQRLKLENDRTSNYLETTSR